MASHFGDCVGLGFSKKKSFDIKFNKSVKINRVKINSSEIL